MAVGSDRAEQVPACATGADLPELADARSGLRNCVARVTSKLVGGKRR